jgi:transcriptional regulator with XRE-family HTH domain
MSDRRRFLGIRRQLRERRLALGLSQATLCGQLGMSRSRFSAIELGRWSMNLRTLERWCAALDCRLTLTCSSASSSAGARFTDASDFVKQAYAGHPHVTHGSQSPSPNDCSYDARRQEERA